MYLAGYQITLEGISVALLILIKTIALRKGQHVRWNFQVQLRHNRGYLRCNSEKCKFKSYQHGAVVDENSQIF